MGRLVLPGWVWRLCNALDRLALSLDRSKEQRRPGVWRFVLNTLLAGESHRPILLVTGRRLFVVN